MEQLCSDKGIQGRVHFLGIRRDIPQLMNAADAYVMSSKWEGMPIVLLEASASALPIVATDVGGNREVVQDNMTGLLVRPGDSDHLCEQMVNMMAFDQDTRKAMGAAGRQFVREHYSMGVIVEQWTQIYGHGATAREVML
ncbi:GDP-mannose-dependent alpha-(1-6)-phosphatidylinositol monomannoside mannosyltransferase [compost metagenome]